MHQQRIPTREKAPTARKGTEEGRPYRPNWREFQKEFSIGGRWRTGAVPLCRRERKKILSSPPLARLEKFVPARQKRQPEGKKKSDGWVQKRRKEPRDGYPKGDEQR